MFGNDFRGRGAGGCVCGEWEEVGVEMRGRARDYLSCIRTQTDVTREVKKKSFTGDSLKY